MLVVHTAVLHAGMDFAGVRTVINYDCPATTADYIHRIGRTGVCVCVGWLCVRACWAVAVGLGGSTRSSAGQAVACKALALQCPCVSCSLYVSAGDVLDALLTQVACLFSCAVCCTVLCWAGRAGHAGQAVTFFTEDDAPKLRGIAHLASQAGSEVPDWMLHLTSQRDRKRARVGKRLRAAAQQQAQQQGQRRRAGLLDVDSDDDEPPRKAATAAGGMKARGSGSKQLKPQKLQHQGSATAAEKKLKKREKKHA